MKRACLTLCLAVLAVLTLTGCDFDFSVNLDASLRQRVSGTVTALFTEETEDGLWEVVALEVPGLGTRHITLTKDTVFYRYDADTHQSQEIDGHDLLRVGDRVEIESERTRGSDRHLAISVTLYGSAALPGSALCLPPPANGSF